METQSVIGEGDEKKIKPRRGQLELPGTRLKIILTILGIILIPLLSFLLIKYSLYTFSRIQQSHRKEVPRQKIRRALRRLLRRMPKIDNRRFYIDLSAILRDYLHHRFTVPALTLTSRELTSFFSAALQEKLLRDSVLQCTLILQEADGIKFGGRSSSAEEKKEYIARILKNIKQIEQEPDHVES